MSTPADQSFVQVLHTVIEEERAKHDPTFDFSYQPVEALGGFSVSCDGCGWDDCVGADPRGAFRAHIDRAIAERVACLFQQVGWRGFQPVYVLSSKADAE